MTIYAGQDITIHISEVSESPDFALLKGMRMCRWRIQQLMEEALPVRADAWARQTASTKRVLSVGCEMVGSSHVAQARAKHAALNDGRVKVKLTLAEGETLEGEMHVERYEELAREDEVLEVEMQLVSVGMITVTE